MLESATPRSDLLHGNLSLPVLPTEGVITARVREIVGDFPAPPPTRIALVGCGVKIHFPWDKACARTREAAAVACNAVAGTPIEIVQADEPFEDPTALLAALECWNQRGLAGVILFHASYTAGELGAHLGRWLVDHRLPVLSWSPPDVQTKASNEANSLCCQNFILQMWQRLGVPYAWVHSPLSGSDAVEVIARFARTARARERFLHGKVLHAGGSRVTAFYDGEADELALMRTFGLRFDRIDLEVVHRHGKKFSDAQVRELVCSLTNDPRCGGVDVPEEQMLRTLRFGLSLADLGLKGGYSGCTFKSWPELFDCYGCAIDGAVSMLNDYGFCTAEEGEMNGIVSSLALHFLSEGRAVPTMMDLSALSPERETIGIWHCGACPTRLLKQGTQYRCTKHSILENGDPNSAVGLMVEFLLESGPATVVRYQSPNARKMFAFEGDLVDTEMPYRGAWAEMRVQAPGTATQVMGTILDAGLDHHWSLGYGRWLQDLRMLNHWLGVEEVPLRNTQTLHGLSR